jgi:hypothetical protein
MSVAIPEAVRTADEAFGARRLRRPATPMPDPLARLHAEDRTRQALIDASRLDVPMSWRMILAANIAAPLPLDVAREFARILVHLGRDYELALAAYGPDRDACWKALYSHANEGARRVVEAWGGVR